MRPSNAHYRGMVALEASETHKIWATGQLAVVKWLSNNALATPLAVSQLVAHIVSCLFAFCLQHCLSPLCTPPCLPKPPTMSLTLFRLCLPACVPLPPTMPLTLFRLCLPACLPLCLPPCLLLCRQHVFAGNFREEALTKEFHSFLAGRHSKNKELSEKKHMKTRISTVWTVSAVSAFLVIIGTRTTNYTCHSVNNKF